MSSAAESGLRARRVWYVYAACWSLIGAVSWTTAAVYFVRDVGMTPLQLVLTGTALEVAYFVFEVPTGVVADLYSRRLSLVVSAVVVGVAMIVTGAVPNVGVVIAAAAVWGFGWTFRSGAEDAWLADEVGALALPAVYQRAAQVDRVAGLVGIGCAVLLSLVSLQLPFLVAGCLALALAGYLLVAMPEAGFVRPVRAAHSPALRSALDTARSGVRVVRLSPLLVLIVGIAVALGAWSEGFDRLWEAHLMLDVGLSGAGGINEVAWFGILSAGGLVLSLVVAAPLVSKVERLSALGTARLLLGLHVLLAGAALAFALAGSVLLAVGMFWATSVVRQLADPPYRSWLNASITDSSVRATVLSLTGVAGSLGEWTGGPVLGVIGTRWSVRVALTWAVALLATVVMLFARAVRHHGRLEAATPSSPDESGLR